MFMDIYGNKENYIITYKGIDGKEHMTSGDATSKPHAEEQFKRTFSPHCEIIKIQTSKEWIKETADDMVNGMMKHVKKGLKSIINPNNTKNIDYNSKSFLKGLKNINAEAEKSMEMSIPNHERMYLSYNN